MPTNHSHHLSIILTVPDSSPKKVPRFRLSGGFEGAYARLGWCVKGI